MAHHKAALKSIRQTKVHTERNRHTKSTMRTAVKKVRALIDDNKLEEAQKMLPQAFSVIDKSVTKGVLHRNAADRTKSRLTVAAKKTERE
ncbi:MAG: 30S ribosomal protein S20 [Acidobacteria bacterium]|jgi:small subunit ribosomal protein S20|nr:30S ribosomal protein S20 [Acidobacteriota bacterium]